ncbi:MAG: hypothetical protein ACK53W_13500 [Gemmatimonadota bacterium]|jgi:transposase
MKARTRPKPHPYVPTDADRAVVEALTAYGIPQAEIANRIGISDRTLRKYYRRELETATTLANAKVAEFLFRQATGGQRGQAVKPHNVTAAMFWLKTRARWKERHVVEHEGQDGGPIRHSVSRAEDEARAFLDELAAAVAGQGTGPAPVAPGGPAGTDHAEDE